MYSYKSSENQSLYACITVKKEYICPNFILPLSPALSVGEFNKTG